MEICINGEYGTVCDDGFDDTDANVICGQLGYGNTGKFILIFGGYALTCIKFCMQELLHNSMPTLVKAVVPLTWMM